MTGPVPSTRESRPMICVFPWPSEINYINFYNEQQQGAKQQALHLDTFNFLAQMIWCPVTSVLAKRCFFFLLFLTIFVLSAHITRLFIGSVTISQKKKKDNKNNNWNYYVPAPPPSSTAICFIYVSTNAIRVIWVFWKGLEITMQFYPLKPSLHGLLYFISQCYYAAQMSDIYIVGFLLLIDFSIGKACVLWT